ELAARSAGLAPPVVVGAGGVGRRHAYARSEVIFLDRQRAITAHASRLDARALDSDRGDSRPDRRAGVVAEDVAREVRRRILKTDRYTADVVELVDGDRIIRAAVRAVDGVEADPAEADVRDGQRRPVHHDRVLLDVAHGTTREVQRAVDREAIVEADGRVGEHRGTAHADADPIATCRRRAGSQR